MDDLARSYALNCFQERLEQRTIVFHPVSQNVNNYNAETQLLEVVFMLKTLVDGYQNITLALRLSNQFGVGKGAPLGFRDGRDFMLGKGLPKTWVNTLV